MLFDSSVRKELARSFGATLVVMLTIVVTMMLIRVLGKAAGGAVSPQDVALLMGYTALGHVATVLTLSLFVAIVSTLTRMYRDSEMVIWMCSGVSLVRLLPTVLGMCWPVLVAVAVLALGAWPWANRQTVELQDRYERRSDLSRVAPGQFQMSADGQRVFFVDKDTDRSATGRNVFVLSQSGDRESVTTAREGRVNAGDDGKRFLVLDKGERTDIDLAKGTKLLSRFDEYRVLASERALRGLDDLPHRARSTWDLIVDQSPRSLGELAWRLGLALAAGNLVLLGVGFSASNPRRGTSWGLMFALLGFVVYYNLINLSQAWVGSGRTSLGGALLGVHGTVLVIAITLLWWRDRGAAAFAVRRAGRAGA